MPQPRECAELRSAPDRGSRCSLRPVTAGVSQLANLGIVVAPARSDHSTERRSAMRVYRRHGALVVLAGVLAIASPRPSVAQQLIQLGASISITGRDAVQGGYVREGYLFCQKHVNEKGGVLGRPIQFVIRDDGSDAQAAIRIYEKLITEDKVDAVMGPYSSPITDAVADVTEKHRKLMVAPGAGTTAIWEKGRRYLVMVLSPLEASTEGTIDLAVRNGLKTIGVIGYHARPAIAKGALETAKK